LKEKVIAKRFEGITRYQLDNKSMPLEHSTHWCLSFDGVLDALVNQKKHFEKQGARIISQRVRKEETVEFYTLGCEE